jgi:tetraacyldisaccharide 4'-kinase
LRAILLYPFTLIYYLINFIWDLYWRLRKPVKLPSKVISIGNLTVGGAGKTPLVAFISKRMLADGKKVAVVARGYGRPESGPVKINNNDPVDWRQAGDEPSMLAQMVPGLTIYVNSSKTEGAKEASADGFDIILIDDGFQHRGLFRDIDIVCLDAGMPFGNGLLLPSGILREPPKALSRANVIVAFGKSNLHGLRFDSKPVYRAIKKVSSTYDSQGAPVSLSDKKILAFCGLGNPESFKMSLRDTGCRIVEFMEYRDHHNYVPTDISRIIERIKQTGAEAAVTTLKDYVKLENLWPSDIAIYRLEIAIELENSDEFFKLLYAARI